MGGSGDQTDSGGLFYNLVTDPTEPGSNGIYDDITAPEETIGGGVLTFEVSGTTTIDGKARIFLLVDLREFFFRFRVGGTKKKKALKMTS